MAPPGSLPAWNRIPPKKGGGGGGLQGARQGGGRGGRQREGRRRNKRKKMELVGYLEKRPKKKKKSLWDFPGNPVVKNPPSKAGDTGLIPGQGGKIAHALGK